MSEAVIILLRYFVPSDDVAHLVSYFKETPLGLDLFHFDVFPPRSNECPLFGGSSHILIEQSLIVAKTS